MTWRLLLLLVLGFMLSAACHTGKRKGDAPASFQPTLYTYLRLVKDKNWMRAAQFWDKSALNKFKLRLQSLPQNVLFASLEVKDVVKVQGKDDELMAIIAVERYAENSITIVREVWQQRWHYDSNTWQWRIVDEQTVNQENSFAN